MNSYPLGMNSYPLGMNSYPLGMNSYPVMDQPVLWGLLCSRGSDRLTSTAQPGLGGKRSDSPKGEITSAVTEQMQVIDHEEANLIEKKLNLIPHSDELTINMSILTVRLCFAI